MRKKDLRIQASREAHYEVKRAIHRAWVAVGCVGAVIVLALVFHFALAVSPGDDTAESPELPPPKFVMEFLPEAEAIARSFFATESVDEKGKHVSDPERVRPLMARYYRENPPKPLQFSELANANPHVADGREFIIAKAVFDDAPRRLLVFERVGDEVLLNWEVAMAYSDLPWETFIAKKVTDPCQFRVMMRQSDYYNWDFSDSKSMLAFTLRSPNDDRILYGYLPVESESFKKYIAVRSLSTLRELPVIIKLRYPDDASQDNQVWIDEIRDFSWVEGVGM